MARKKNLQHPIIAKVIADGKQETLDKLERNELAIYWENSFPILYIGNGAGKGTPTTSNLYDVFNIKYTSYFQNSTQLFRLYFNIVKPLDGKKSLSLTDPGIYELKRGDTALSDCPLPKTGDKLDVGGFLFIYEGTTQKVQIIVPVNSTSDVFWYRCWNTQLESGYGDWYQICDFSSIQTYVTATIKNTCKVGTIKNALTVINDANTKQSVLPYYYFNSYGKPANLNTKEFYAAVYTTDPDDENVIRIQNVSKNTFLDWLDINYLDDSLNQAKNTVFASPTNTIGTPSFRHLVAADIPDLSGTYAKKDHTHSNYLTATETSKDVNFKSVGAGAYYKGGIDLDNVYAAKSHTHSDYLSKSNGGSISAKSGISFSYGSSQINGFIRQYSNSELRICAPKGDLDQNTARGCGLSFKSCAYGILPMSNGIINGISEEYLENRAITLGSASCSFQNVYVNGVALTSDKKEKKDIESLKNNYNTYKSIFNDIDFIKYRWRYNNNYGLADKPSSRYHYGVISQYVEEIFKNHGLDNSDNGIIKASFFLNNTTDRYICGGWEAPYYDEEKDIQYSYSENVWNYKHDLDYDINNEILEQDIYKLTNGFGYRDRSSIGYIMIEDNSKVQADGYHPPITINSINLVDKDGNYTLLEFEQENNVPYYSEDDINMETPLTQVEFVDETSFTITSDVMYGKHAIKLLIPFDINNYEKIIIDADYIGEYKIYLLPEGNYKSTNFLYDIERVGEKIVYDYSVDYQELTNMSLMVLQQQSIEFDKFKEEKEKEITELKENYNSLLKRIEALENKK